MGWKEGSAEKIMLHGLIGGIMADINGGKFGEGLTVGAINEILIGQLSKLTKKDEKGKDVPLLSSDQMRWISAIVGGVVSEATGGNAGQGSSIADSATANNFLSHAQKAALEKAREEGDEDLVAFYEELDKKQNAIATAMGINWQLTDWDDPVNKELLDRITSQSLNISYDDVVIGRESVNNIVKWVQDTGQNWEEFGNGLAAGQAIDYAENSLKHQGISKDDANYNQKLIEEALKFETMIRSAEEMAASFSGGLKVTSLIKNETNLIRAAERMGKNMAAQKEANELIAKLLSGNTNPGKGTENLFKGICYLRGKEGARVFYRVTDNGVEILAKADKTNETEVIRILEKLYK